MNKAATVLPSTILMDCKEQDITGKPFTTEHAENLVALQHEKGYNHWQLSAGQNLKVKDGKIISSGSSAKNTETKSE